MLRIANMSRKESLIYLILLTFFFVGDLILLVVGLIFHSFSDPSLDPPWAIPMIITALVLIFCCLFTIMLSSLSSNYVKRHPEAKNNVAKNPEEKK